MKIVFCEDDLTIQKLIRVAFRSTAHELYLASDGVEGLTLIERERPALVFLDVSMPKLDGFQVCESLKTQPYMAHIPIILMTASVQRAQIEEGYLHGATGYFPKPFSPAELRAKVEELAGKDR